MCCTIRMGTGNVPGNSDNIRFKAAGPPVEAAMATMATSWTTGSGAIGPTTAGELREVPTWARFHRRTTFTSDINLRVLIIVAASVSEFGSPGPAGFFNTASAPASKARMAVPTSLKFVLAVHTTIGTGFDDMIRRVVSMPSIPGI